MARATPEVARKQRVALNVLERMRSLIDKPIYNELESLIDRQSFPGATNFLKSLVRQFRSHGKLSSADADRLIARLDNI